MKLTTKQIQDITFGYVQAEETESGLAFYRFTKAHTDFIYTYSGDYGTKSKATSSIRLDFYTDSDFFRFAYANAQKASSRPWYYFSLYVNGELVSTFGEDTLINGLGSCECALPKGNNRVTLFFPNLFRADVTAVEVSDGASVTPFKPKHRIVFHGDSITHGYDAKNPALSYVNRLAMAWDAEIINYGIGGARFDERIIHEETSPSADAVFVAYGTNDWKCSKSWENLEIACKTFFKKLVRVHKNTPVFAILPIWRCNYKDETPSGDFMSVRQNIAKIAKEIANATPIDTWDDLPQDLDLFTDGLHPNDNGFAYYAKAVIKNIEKETK